MKQRIKLLEAQNADQIEKIKELEAKLDTACTLLSREFDKRKVWESIVENESCDCMKLKFKAIADNPNEYWQVTKRVPYSQFITGLLEELQEYRRQYGRLSAR